ncbi:hypothetical protein DOY81_008318, partial [Sarcophaga bullata]
MAKEKGLIVINGFRFIRIILGRSGTMGVEILEQVPNPGCWFIIPCGERNFRLMAWLYLLWYNALLTAAPLIDKMLVVQEEWIALAILRLVEEEKCVVEGAGASAFASILAGLVPELQGKKVVVVLSGGNIDTTVFGRCLERGLAAEGRLVKFIIEVPDCPGGINGLCDILTNLGVSIKDIMHE